MIHYIFISWPRCDGIPVKCHNNDDGEVLCGQCAKNMDNVSQAKVVQNMINKLDSKCLTLNNDNQNASKSESAELNEGQIAATQSNVSKEECEWIGKIGEWDEHKKECKFMIVSCDKCTTYKCQRRKLSNHYEVCGDVTIECSLHCGMLIYESFIFVSMFSVKG